MQLLVTLMKLRLNLNNEDIGYRFAVHPITVSRTITAMLDILYGKLKPMIMWPSKEDWERTTGIEVERVIGLVRKKYTILSNTLPMDYVILKEGQSVPILDKIVLVSCALVNFCDSVIPFD